MDIICLLLAIAGIGLFIAGFFGHTAAWPASTLCFFAITMLCVGQRKK